MKTKVKRNILTIQSLIIIKFYIFYLKLKPKQFGQYVIPSICENAIKNKQKYFFEELKLKTLNIKIKNYLPISPVKYS